MLFQLRLQEGGSRVRSTPDRGEALGRDNFLTSGAASAARAAAFIRSSTGFGMPTGATSAIQASKL